MKSWLGHIHSIEFINSICVIKKCNHTHVLGRRVIAGSVELVRFGHLPLHGAPACAWINRTRFSPTIRFH